VCGQIACCTHLLVYLSGAVVAAPPNLSARRSGQEWSNVILSRTAVVVRLRRKQGSSEVDPAISTASLLLNGGDKQAVQDNKGLARASVLAPLLFNFWFDVVVPRLFIAPVGCRRLVAPDETLCCRRDYVATARDGCVCSERNGLTARLEHQAVQRCALITVHESV